MINTNKSKATLTSNVFSVLDANGSKPALRLKYSLRFLDGVYSACRDAELIEPVDIVKAGTSISILRLETSSNSVISAAGTRLGNVMVVENFAKEGYVSPSARSKQIAAALYFTQHGLAVLWNDGGLLRCTLLKDAQKAALDGTVSCSSASVGPKCTASYWEKRCSPISLPFEEANSIALDGQWSLSKVDISTMEISKVLHMVFGLAAMRGGINAVNWLEYRSTAMLSEDRLNGVTGAAGWNAEDWMDRLFPVRDMSAIRKVISVWNGHIDFNSFICAMPPIDRMMAEGVYKIIEKKCVKGSFIVGDKPAPEEMRTAEGIRRMLLAGWSAMNYFDITGAGHGSLKPEIRRALFDKIKQLFNSEEKTGAIGWQFLEQLYAEAGNIASTDIYKKYAESRLSHFESLCQNVPESFSEWLKKNVDSGGLVDSIASIQEWGGCDIAEASMTAALGSCSVQAEADRGVN